MTSISSLNTVLNIITQVKNLKKGYLTNFFLDTNKIELWIKLNIVFYKVIGDTAFLFRKNQEFYNLFYISTDTDALDADSIILCENFPNEIFVIDIVGRAYENEIIKNIFQKNGFYQYTSLVRMSTISKNILPLDPNMRSILYADPTKVQSIYDMLQNYFDPYAEQLPLIDEIITWTENKRILIYCDNNHTIHAFLIFDLVGQTSYLRYWFVHPDYREKKIGSTLLHKFFDEGKETTRRLFWVIVSNDNAIKRYEHYGFKKEELFDIVMINKNICYEG